jgi:hypothetical protein
MAPEDVHELGLVVRAFPCRAFYDL